NVVPGESFGDGEQDFLDAPPVGFARSTTQGFEGFDINQARFFLLHLLVVAGKGEGKDVGCPVDTQNVAGTAPFDGAEQAGTVESVLLAVEPEPEVLAIFIPYGVEQGVRAGPWRGWRIGVARSGRDAEEAFEQVDGAQGDEKGDGWLGGVSAAENGVRA